MVIKQESKPHRKWTPQQKFAILQEVRAAAMGSVLENCLKAVIRRESPE